jgi:hypothetical protein
LADPNKGEALELNYPRLSIFRKRDYLEGIFESKEIGGNKREGKIVQRRSATFM